jgi:hypothetical protein
MKTAKHNTTIGGLHLLIAFVAMAAVLGTFAPAAQAHTPVVVTGSTDIKVWVDRPWNVYSSYDDVVISIHAARDCYLAVFLIDTLGFVHVVHPFSPFESAWVHGGVRYRFNGRELGLGVLGGRGIAHVFAVGSPYPFDFEQYGRSIFVGGFGYRVYGDPYLACRELYMTVLPGAYWRNLAGFGFARFYVREWARYPMYLCHGYHDAAVRVRVGGRCARCYRVYDDYRGHVNNPSRTFLTARTEYKEIYRADRTRTRARVQRTNGGHKYKEIIERAKTKPEVPRSARTTKIVSAKRTDITAKPIDKPVRVRAVRPVKATDKTSKTRKVVRATTPKKNEQVKVADKRRATKTKTTKGKVR